MGDTLKAPVMSTSPITSALLNSAYQPQQTDLFGRIDANSDGQISPDELTSFGQNLPGANGTGLKSKKLFQKIDTNGDGIVTKEEWAAHRQQRQKSAAALLQVQEQAGTRKQSGPSGPRQVNPGSTFSTLDTNRDGMVSREEWAASFGAAGSVTLASDVKPVGAAADTGITAGINSTLDSATSAVKNTVSSIAQTINALL
jgi:Ca2+-binding EF-hand superfamily protein